MIAKLFARKDVASTTKWNKFVQQVRAQLLKKSDDEGATGKDEHGNGDGGGDGAAAATQATLQESPEKDADEEDESPDGKKGFILGCYRVKEGTRYKAPPRNLLNEYFSLLGSLQAVHQILKASNSDSGAGIRELAELFQILVE